MSKGTAIAKPAPKPVAQVAVPPTLTVKNAEQLDTVWTHWFFYGDTGSGKTEIAHTFPRPLFLAPSNEGSIVTLRGRNQPYIEITGMSKAPLREGSGSMDHALDAIERLYRADPTNFPYDTIVVESLSHYGDLVIDELTNGGKGQMSQNLWGTFGSHIKGIQTRLRTMDVHVVFNALAKIDVVEKGEGTQRQVFGSPYIQGQSAEKLPSACDVYGYVELYGDQHRVHFKKYQHFPARTRFSRMPKLVNNFHYDDIKQYLEVAP
jgi:AAA domain-containing protein